MKLLPAFAISFLLTTSFGALASACPCNEPSPRAIRAETVRAALDDLLRAEGVTTVEEYHRVLRF